MPHDSTNDPPHRHSSNQHSSSHNSSSHNSSNQHSPGQHSQNQHGANLNSRKLGEIKRRDFLTGCAAALTLTSCGGGSHKVYISGELPEPTETQRALRRSGRSKVGLIKVESYEDDIFKAIKPFLPMLALPDLSNKTVVLKPNMVEFHPDHPITTNPHAIKAAVELVDYLGAKEIIIAEGPGHMRDTEFLLEASGIGPMCSKLSLPFVDLNLDDLEKVPVKDGFSKMEHFYLPKTIMHADAVISLPKMKTHHWVGMTASMKNLFGTVPGRKYGWPKNILHWKGIPACILDLVQIVQPKFAFVDAIVAMEGDGPINGIAKKTGFIALGENLAAVDATCARTMSIPIEKLNYIHIAGKVVGTIDENEIDIVGAPIATLKKPFELPATFNDKKLLAQAGSQAS